MGELKWYVVRSVSGQEKKAKTYMETEIGRHNLQDLLPQVLIPIEKVFEMRNGKKRVRERNLYPGYIIIHSAVTHGEVLNIITSTPGVIGRSRRVTIPYDPITAGSVTGISTSRLWRM